MTTISQPGKLALDRIALLRALLALNEHDVAPIDAQHRPASVEDAKVGDIAIVTTRSKRHYALITGVGRNSVDLAFLTRAAVRTARDFYDPRVSDPQFGEILAAQAERSSGRVNVDNARRLGHIQHHVAKAFRHMPAIAFANVTIRVLPCKVVDIVCSDDSPAQRCGAEYATQLDTW